MKLIDISTPKSPNTFTMVDDEDFDWLNQWKWRLTGNKQRYALRWVSVDGVKTMISMHRVIAAPASGLMVDHINGDGLDNRRENLRACSNAENQHNQSPRTGTSKYKGVYFAKREKLWIAQIKSNGKITRIGYFKLETDAALAYNDAAKKHFGAFARMNVVTHAPTQPEAQA